MRLSTELAMEVYIQRVSSLDERMSQSNIIIFYAAVLLSRSPAKVVVEYGCRCGCAFADADADAVAARWPFFRMCLRSLRYILFASSQDEN